MKTLLLITLLSLTTYAGEVKFSGKAYRDKSKKELIYTEHHTQTVINNRLSISVTQYSDSSNKRIAFLKSDYEKNSYFPDFDFLDERTNYKELLTKGKESFSASTSKKSKTIKSKPNSSTGQGLNELIKANLSKLANRKNITTKFFLVGRMQFVSMLITGKSVSNDKVKVKIMVKNFFLRLFAPKIEMIYDKNTKRLLNYYGLSNILTMGGKSQQVYIEYSY